MQAYIYIYTHAYLLNIISISLCNIYEIPYCPIYFIKIIFFVLFIYIVDLNLLFYQYNYINIDSNSSLSSTNSKFNQDFLSTTAMYALVILFIVAIYSEGVKLFIFGLVIITNVYQVREQYL